MIRLVFNHRIRRSIWLTIAISVFPLTAISVGGVRALEGISWGTRHALSEIAGIGSPVHHLKIGVYDPSDSFEDAENISIDLSFIDWVNYDRNRLIAEIRQSKSRMRWPMITTEPWPVDRNSSSRDTFLTDIASGQYNTSIQNLCSDIEEAGSPVFIRWGHEMENVSGRYPWATAVPSDYIDAYRHFVQICRQSLEVEHYFVWSPVGDAGLNRYWPGRDVVDHIGISVFGFPEFDLKYHDRVRSFQQIVKEKYTRVEAYDRPIIIAESGVSGGSNHQKTWLYQAFNDAVEYPALTTLVYFNSRDVDEAWGTEFDTPDWSIDTQMLDY